MLMKGLHFLKNSDTVFPPTSLALEDPQGLLAVGGDLSLKRLLNAYSQGIFPWYSEGQAIMWWTPSPRLILLPNELHVGRSSKKLLRKRGFHISVDQAFTQVIENCAQVSRKGEQGSWITAKMQTAYINLHKHGYAHSVEAWQDEELVGGLYGVSLGKVFFGESMFSLVSGASRVAFLTLVYQLQKWGFACIDCQMHTDYLASFGAKQVSREQFESLLQAGIKEPNAGQNRLNWSREWSMQENDFD